MIGVFDSGVGGLTVLRELAARFPAVDFRYFGDHARMPYGDRTAPDIVDFTRAGIEQLFGEGCRLVLLACNTATAVAARRLQTEWLPRSRFPGHNVLGIIAPTVEAATQTPWAVTTPQYPQKYNSDTIVVFGTTRTITSGVFPEEIKKRCPNITVVQAACPGLADAIEHRRPEAEIDTLVRRAVEAALTAAKTPPHRAILGCTHYPIVTHMFARHLPGTTRVLGQPEVVADSLDHYLARHPHYVSARAGDQPRSIVLRTSGEPAAADAVAGIFWPEAPAFATDADRPSAYPATTLIA